MGADFGDSRAMATPVSPVTVLSEPGLPRLPRLPSCVSSTTPYPLSAHLASSLIVVRRQGRLVVEILLLRVLSPIKQPLQPWRLY